MGDCRKHGTEPLYRISQREANFVYFLSFDRGIQVAFVASKYFPGGQIYEKSDVALYVGSLG